MMSALERHHGCVAAAAKVKVNAIGPAGDLTYPFDTEQRRCGNWATNRQKLAKACFSGGKFSRKALKIARLALKNSWPEAVAVFALGVSIMETASRILAIALLALGLNIAQAADTAKAQTSAQAMEFYLGGAVTYSETDVDSGGFNTAGGFSNFLGDSDDGVGLSVVMGLDNMVQFGNQVSLRGEAEFNWRPDQNYITGSFPGPPGPPAFLYRTSVEESFSLFANLFVDVEVFSPFSVFAGGGIGVAHHDVSTTDFVVSGASSGTEFAYHVGGGVIFDLSQSVSIVGGARYMDLGTSDTPLDGGASGNYTLDHEVVEGRIGVNVKLGPLTGAP